MPGSSLAPVPESAAPAIHWAGEPPGLLGLLVLRLLRRAAALRPDAARRLADRRLRLRSGLQSVTLAGHDGHVEARGDDVAAVDATAEGDLATLLAAARGHAVREALLGRLRVRGRVWRLSPLLALFRALAIQPTEEPMAAGGRSRAALAAAMGDGLFPTVRSARDPD